MRPTTAAILAGLLLGGTAYAQPAPNPGRPPISSPAPQQAQIQPAQIQPASPSSPERQVAAPVTFAVGDVVELKSGSPHMTVIEVGADIQVLWYTSDKGLQRERFPAAALEKTDLNEPDEYAPDQGRSAQPMAQPPEQPRRYEGTRRYEGMGRDEGMGRGMDRSAEDHRMRHMRWREEMRDDHGPKRDWRWRDRRYHSDDEDDVRYERRR